MKKIKLFKKLKGISFLGLCVLAENTLAALPTNADTGVVTTGSWVDTLKGLFKDGIGVVALLLAAGGLIWVSWASISKFNDCRNGKAEYGELGFLVVIGAFLLLLIMWLLGVVNTIFN